MKTRKLLSTLALAGAGLMAGGAYAADVSKPLENLVLVDNGAYFGALYTGNNAGNTFTDKYAFTTTVSGILSGDLSSTHGNIKNGLDITDFSLYNAGGLVLAGTSLSTGLLDQWTFTTDTLAAGDYWVQVSGSVLSNAAGKYYANIALAPVPEPATYGMMLGGMGLLGVMARRRRKNSPEA